MIRVFSRLAPAFIALSCLSLFAQDPPLISSPPEIDTGTDLVRELDSDKDGYVSQSEWAAFFLDRDRDGDGKLFLGEPKPVQVGESEKSVSESDRGRLEAFARLDGNGNEVIDTTEWPGRAVTYRFLDADHNGSISRNEFLAKKGRWWNDTLQNLDFDGDGVIERSEWLESKSSFDRLDRDSDGVIERSEFYNPR